KPGCRTSSIRSWTSSEEQTEPLPPRVLSRRVAEAHNLFLPRRLVRRPAPVDEADPPDPTESGPSGHHRNSIVEGSDVRQASAPGTGTSKLRTRGLQERADAGRGSRARAGGGGAPAVSWGQGLPARWRRRAPPGSAGT